MNTVLEGSLKGDTPTSRPNKPPAPLTARTKRRTADHSGRKRRSFFFGGAASCTLLDDTWNTGTALFLSGTILSRRSHRPLSGGMTGEHEDQSILILDEATSTLDSTFKQEGF